MSTDDVTRIGLLQHTFYISAGSISDRAGQRNTKPKNCEGNRYLTHFNLLHNDVIMTDLYTNRCILCEKQANYD